MFCSKCGSKIEEGNNFCTNCQSPVRKAVKVAAATSAKKRNYTTVNRPGAGLNKPAVPAPGGELILLTAFFAKYKWHIILITSVLIIISVVVKLLEPKPDNDARLFLQAQCNCEKQGDAESDKVYETFKKDFNVTRYKSRADAYAELNRLTQPIGVAQTQCLQTAEQKKQNLRARYLSNYAKLAIFDNTINTNVNSCVRDAVRTRNGEIDQLIALIKDPTPDVNKMKSDLIGREIPGWRFAYLNEFTDINILNTTTNGNRMEFQVKMHLHDNNNNTDHECLAILVYISGTDGWFFSEVHETYFTNILSAPVGQWQKVFILPNTHFTIEAGNNHYWVFDGGYVQRKYTGGPDEPGISLVTDDIYIMSRENSPVQLVFKFVPIN